MECLYKRTFALTSFLLVFAVLIGSYAHAGGISSSTFSSTFSASDVSVDSVKVNGKAFAEDRTNFIEDTVNLDVVVGMTAVKDLSDVHVEAVLTDLRTGNTIADTTGTFVLKQNQNTLVALNLRLIDKLKREKEFRLEINIIGVNGNKEQKTFGLRFTGAKAGAGRLDVSIDRIRVNSNIVAESKTNFIDRSTEFDILIEFTALEDLEDAHVEAVIKDLRSGLVVADASPNFNLVSDTSSSKSLRVKLLDKLRLSDSFELNVKIVDKEGNFVQKTFGLRLRGFDLAAGGSSSFRLLDISIDSVELEGKTLAENENNFLIIDKGEKKLKLRVRLTALENVEDAHVDAVLAFENGDVVADATVTFDIADGANAVKELELPLVGMFEQNNFRLKAKVVDTEGDFEEKSYGLRISQKKFPFVISSISLSPESNAEAGKSLIAGLSIKNSGVVPLEGISAKVSITELGISSAKFVDQIKSSKPAGLMEEFTLKIPDTAATGTYTLRSEISSQFGHDSEVKEIPIFIVGKEEQKKQVVNDRLVINIPILKQNIKNDGSEAAYPVILTNEGPDANSYTLLLDGAGWADLRLSDSNFVVINPKESRTINIFASSRKAALGEQIFMVAIKSSDKVLKQVPLKGNVTDAGGIALSLKDFVEMALIGFVVLAVLIGLLFGIRGYMKDGRKDAGEEIPDQEQGEAYY
ncbi:hypothetical protein HYY70_01120 [Candidatus Woesearchaeota archaeon]|nr:hypothetical protein [Candidatus Woesearchaeota archaeon]